MILKLAGVAAIKPLTGTTPGDNGAAVGALVSDAARAGGHVRN
jgi:hypothetical protein